MGMIVAILLFAVIVWYVWASWQAHKQRPPYLGGRKNW